ncbi:MAG: hypothetical protein AAGA91_17950 [Pseudomonadota bacterium]
MWTFLLIAFVLALALAPLIHVLPSKGQRRLARLREYAAVHGMFVESRRPPGNEASDARPVIYYGQRFPTSSQREFSSASWACANGQWRRVGRGPRVPTCISDCPVSLEGASVDQYSCGVYWDEAGDEACIEHIRVALAHWTEHLIG